MSYETVLLCVNDVDLRGRIKVAQQKEAIYNPYVNNPELVRENPERFIMDVLWPLSFSEEAAYEYAILTENLRPGNDPAVISDATILSAVTTYWPGGVSAPLPPAEPLVEPST